MRHPLTTSGRRRRLQGLAAVANVNGFVVVDAFGQAVPQGFQPSVGQGAQGRVVALARRDFGVGELARPDAAGQAAEGPLVHGGAQVVVVRQAAGDDEFAAAGAAGVLIGTTPSETSNLQPRPPRTLSHVSPRGTRTESVARRFQP